MYNVGVPILYVGGKGLIIYSILFCLFWPRWLYHAVLGSIGLALIRLVSHFFFK